MRNVVERTIAWGDLDALGIVFYPRYYEWMDDCGHRFFDALGLNLGKLMQEKGLIFGLVETGFRYERPGRYGERVHTVTRLTGLGEKTLVLETEILRLADEGRLAVGFEKRICLSCSDPGKLRAVDIPRPVAEKLRQALEAGSAPLPGPAV